MKNFTKSLSILVAFSILAACNVYQEVKIAKDKTVDFDKYATYAWLPDQEPGSDSDYNNDFIRQKTRNYFGHCMAQRQLKADTLTPELLLQIRWLSHAREVEVPAVPDLPSYNDIDYYNAPSLNIYGGKPVWGKEYKETEKVQYAHGGAKLTVIDRSTKDIVWEGVALGDLYDPNVMYEDLHPAIHKMMKKFPIKIPKN